LIHPDLRPLVPAYLARRREDVTAIERAIEQADAEAIRWIGHEIAGTGSTYGFDELTRLGRALNEAARLEDLAECATVMRALREFLSAQPDQ
jgi:HPt (histidine-containing phosphotransfer) domain-containing protein